MRTDTKHEERAMTIRQRFAGPIWTLLLLGPFIAEVLSGSTRTSILFVYLPEVMVWGVGVLLCRELIRRWRAGGTSLLLLGMALAIAEEFLIQQTSLAPLPFPGSHPEYGRIWGVNLIYFLFMLGYESVWVVVVPVHVTELFFPQRAAQPWLRKRGVVIACIVFLIGSRIAWYGWTQQARPRLNAAPYRPSVAMIALGILAIGGLIAFAYLVRDFGKQWAAGQRKAVPAWLAGLMSFVMGAAWFWLLSQQFIPKPVQPFWIAVAAGTGWALLAYILFARLSSSPAWGNGHTFTAAFGATLGCMVTPYLTINSWPIIDVVGEIIFDVLALVGFALLGKKVFSGRKDWL
jgi:hypothetical protein